VGAVALEECRTVPEGLNDSKVLTSARRRELQGPLKAWAAGWGLGWVSAAEIDTFGLRASLTLALVRALDDLNLAPSHLLIDGPVNLADPGQDLPLGCPSDITKFSKIAATMVVQGDRKSATIAAASVLAKVARDDYMSERGALDARYDWQNNLGYGPPLTHGRWSRSV
jgi:ribonuclease HII